METYLLVIKERGKNAETHNFEAEDLNNAIENISNLYSVRDWEKIGDLAIANTMVGKDQVDLTIMNDKKSIESLIVRELVDV